MLLNVLLSALFVSCTCAAAISKRQAPSGVPSYVLDYGKLYHSGCNNLSNNNSTPRIPVLGRPIQAVGHHDTIDQHATRGQLHSRVKYAVQKSGLRVRLYPFPPIFTNSF